MFDKSSTQLHDSIISKLDLVPEYVLPEERSKWSTTYKKKKTKMAAPGWPPTFSGVTSGAAPAAANSLFYKAELCNCSNDFTTPYRKKSKLQINYL